MAARVTHIGHALFLPWSGHGSAWVSPLALHRLRQASLFQPLGHPRSFWPLSLQGLLHTCPPHTSARHCLLLHGKGAGAAPSPATRRPSHGRCSQRLHVGPSHKPRRGSAHPNCVLPQQGVYVRQISSSSTLVSLECGHRSHSPDPQGAIRDPLKRGHEHSLLPPPM